MDDEQMRTAPSIQAEWTHDVSELFAARAKRALGRRVSLGSDTWGETLRLNWGMPDPAELPAEETAAAITAVLREEMPAPLEYDWPQGDPTLREVMAARLAIQNEVEIAADHVTFSAGSSLALDNFCRAVLEPGDVVITEDPSYPGTLHHYRLSDTTVVGVEVDEEGMRTDLLADTLERLRQEGRRVKVIHLIPDFQNPTGNTISLRRRREVLALAAEHRVLIAEDVAYRELYFEEPPPPSFYTLARGQGVVQLGTFSKTWATGLRVGWALAGPELARAIAATHTEAGISAVLTRAMRRIIEDGLLDRRIREQRVGLRVRRDAAIAGLRRYAGESIRFGIPDGGYFLWLRLPEAADARECVLKTIEEGAMALPGAPFFVDNRDRPFMRIAYSYLSPADLDEAMRRIARGVDRALAARPARP